MEQNGKILGIGAVIAAVVIPIVGFFMDTVGFGIDILQVWPQQKHLVKKTDRFSCELREGKDKNDPKVWTVMYESDKDKKPWLGIVIPMGGGWTRARRCEEIERRLEYFRQDGLDTLEYRKDPNTPEQQVICAKTQLSRNNCPLLLTLDAGVDGYQALVDMTTALINSNTFNQNSEAKLANSKFSKELPVIYLQPFLAKEDRLPRNSF
ncbi:MAG: COP23 domain-containing protein [Trichodesmium sp. MAG_R03]|nr:COP23 domain-containing protein [Trichodesmium sp. MAG_R03]